MSARSWTLLFSACADAGIKIGDRAAGDDGTDGRGVGVTDRLSRDTIEGETGRDVTFVAVTIRGVGVGTGVGVGELTVPFGRLPGGETVGVGEPEGFTVGVGTGVGVAVAVAVGVGVGVAVGVTTGVGVPGLE